MNFLLKYNSNVYTSIIFLLGELTTISEENDGLYATEATLPIGPRQRLLLGGTVDQTVTCESCDVNQIQGIHYDPYYIHLAESRVYIFTRESEGWSLFQQLQLDPECTPKHLVQAYTNIGKYYVICTSAPRFQQISFDSEIFRLSDMYGRNDPFLGSNAIIVSGMDIRTPSLDDDYLIWIEDNDLYAYSITHLIKNGLSLPPDVECDDLTRLHPLSPNQRNPRFILDCTDGGIERRFEINDILSASSAIRIVSDGTPFESPGGEFLLLLQATNIALYRTPDYSSMSFSSNISEISFFQVDERVYLDVAAAGVDLVVVDVATFVASGGIQGVHELIDTAQTCPAIGQCLPHGLVHPHSTWYMAIVQDQTDFTARFYNLNNPSNPPQILSNIPSRPEIAFVELHPSVTLVPTSPSKSQSSSQPPLTHTAVIIVPTVSMYVKVDTVGGDGNELKRVEIGLIAIGFGITIIVLLIAIIGTICHAWRRAQRKSKRTGYINATSTPITPVEVRHHPSSDEETGPPIIVSPVQATSDISKSRDQLHITDSGLPSSEGSFHPTPVADHRILQQQQQEQACELHDRLAVMSTRRSDSAMSGESNLSFSDRQLQSP